MALKLASKRELWHYWSKIRTTGRYWELVEQWGTGGALGNINWSKIRRITKAKLASIFSYRSYYR